jgi:photosystem II stability/assembly factor-like uncharacterized protein
MMADEPLELGSFDAPKEIKLAWERRLRGLLPPELAASAGVELPGQAATSAAGGRAPVRGRPSWIPLGPRNVGGRVRTLAIHPTNPRILYAGPASGGVFKTVDGGETWFPLWHDEPSLAMGAIGICRDHPEVVYTATGEIRTGGGESIPGNGVYRSLNDGEDWTQVGTPANLHDSITFDAIAVHPTNRDICWAVGPKGIFRTRNGGLNWDVYQANAYYSDVVLSRTAAGADIAYFVRAQAVGGNAVIVRIDNPHAAGLADADFNNANNRTTLTHPVAGTPAPGRGKLAIASSNPDVVYVHYADVNSGHWALWRSRNARAAPANTLAWQRLADHANWAAERQGSYNLCIAVSPANENHLATGMVDLYVATNANVANPANVNWIRAMAWDLYHLDRGHHADNHQLAFGHPPGAGAPPSLWVANDGGISVSTDWSTGASYPNGTIVLPLPANTVTWRKRSHGILASQMYDLTQHPRIPTLYGCGFQDNGVYFTTGGNTWQLVLGADGGFLAFDPNDPYRFLATWQGGIAEVRFAGALKKTIPPPGVGVTWNLWPRSLTQGFLETDGPRFVADTEHHPLKSSRVLHSRWFRLYGTSDGERWQVEPAGVSVELQAGTPPAGGDAVLEIRPSAAAAKLGLLPALARDGARARCYSLRPGPYGLADGDALELTVNGTNRTITFRTGGAIADLSQATPGEVAAYIRSQGIAQLQAWPQFWGPVYNVEIVSTATGAAARITLGGTAAGVLRRGTGTYRGENGRPVSFTLLALSRDLTGRNLTIRVGAGGTTHNVDLSSPPFANLASIQAGELARAINDALGDDIRHARAVAVTVRKSLRLTATAGTFTAGGTAAPVLGLAPGPHATVQIPPQRIDNQYDLQPPAPGAHRVLTLNDGAHPAMNITFDAATNIVDLQRATVEEVRRVIAAALAGINIRCDLQVAHLQRTAPDWYSQGEPTEIRYCSGRPDTVWVGGRDGRVLLSTNDGRRWRDVSDDKLLAQNRQVEAIAVHPTDPRIAYVGLAGTQNGANDPGFLFKTDDGGESWHHVGAGGSGVKDGAGKLVGVHALEIDPGDPDTLFAATDAGVFRSENGAQNWAPFNEGLPNARAVDLALVASTRTLRVGIWGRGVYERRLTNEGHRDVRLYMRTSLLDDGSGRPAPGGLDGFATVPTEVSLLESPDIKVSVLRPPLIGADEVVDGVEFDEDIQHEEPAPGRSHIFVQIHNRGPFEATGVRLVALWADAGSGIPDLPEDFWAGFPDHPPAVAEPWHLIGEFTFVEATAGDGRNRVVVGHPRVHTFDRYNWPAQIAEAEKIAILVLATSTQDPLATTQRNVERLLRSESKVVCRLTATRRADSINRIQLVSTGTGASITLGGNAQGSLNLPAGGAGTRYLRSNTAGPYNIPLVGANPRVLTVNDGTHNANIPFRQGEQDIADLANARAAEVRRVLNRELFRNRLAVRAIVGNVDLCVSESTTDQGDLPVRIQSGHLAELVAVAPPPVDPRVAPADRPALFDAVARLKPNSIKRNVNNFFYLRLRNLGSADQADVRYRLFQLNLDASPKTHDLRAGPHTVDLSFGATAIEELSWNPGTVDAGTTLVLFAVVDHAEGDPVDLPANFADFQSFHNFCLATNNVAYRRFEVVA